MAGTVLNRPQHRRRKEILRRSGGLACSLLMFAAFAPIAGQQFPPNLPNQRTRAPFDGLGDRDDPALAARQMKALNAERQKSLVSDTAKLLKLTQELNREIGNGNREALTPVELRKISDIEKLARNVKQKMSISYAGGSSGTPIFDTPIPDLVR